MQVVFKAQNRAGEYARYINSRVLHVTRANMLLASDWVVITQYFDGLPVERVDEVITDMQANNLDEIDFIVQAGRYIIHVSFERGEDYKTITADTVLSGLKEALIMSVVATDIFLCDVVKNQKEGE